MSSGGPQAVVDALGPNDAGVTRQLRIRQPNGSEVTASVTKAEYEEVLGVAVYMDGGPGLMYAAHALEAFEQFSAG